MDTRLRFANAASRQLATSPASQWDKRVRFAPLQRQAEEPSILPSSARCTCHSLARPRDPSPLPAPVAQRPLHLLLGGFSLPEEAEEFQSLPAKRRRRIHSPQSSPPVLQPGGSFIDSLNLPQKSIEDLKRHFLPDGEDWVFTPSPPLILMPPKKATSKRKRVNAKTSTKGPDGPEEGVGQQSPSKKLKRVKAKAAEPQTGKSAKSPTTTGEGGAGGEGGANGHDVFEFRADDAEEEDEVEREEDEVEREEDEVEREEDEVEREPTVGVDLDSMNRLLGVSHQAQGVAHMAKGRRNDHQNASPAEQIRAHYNNNNAELDHDPKLSATLKCDQLEHELSDFVERQCKIIESVTDLTEEQKEPLQGRQRLEHRLKRAMDEIHVDTLEQSQKEKFLRRILAAIAKTRSKLKKNIVTLKNESAELMREFTETSNWIQEYQAGVNEKWLEAKGLTQGIAGGERENGDNMSVISRRSIASRSNGNAKKFKRAQSEEKAENLKNANDYYTVLSQMCAREDDRLGLKRQKELVDRKRLMSKEVSTTPRRPNYDEGGDGKREEEDDDWWLVDTPSKVKKEHDNGEKNKGGGEGQEEEEDEVEDDEESYTSTPGTPKPLPAPRRRRADPSREKSKQYTVVDPTPTPSPPPHLGDDISQNPQQSRIQLGSEAPTERVSIPAFGEPRKPGLSPPDGRPKPPQEEEWPSPQLGALIDGVKMFWKDSGEKLAERIKWWDYEGYDGKGNGKGKAGGVGRRVLRGRSVKEIRKKVKAMGKEFTELGAKGEGGMMWEMVGRD